MPVERRGSVFFTALVESFLIKINKMAG